MTGTRDLAREARNAYRRNWYKENKDKVKEYQDRYWEKIARAAEERKENKH